MLWPISISYQFPLGTSAPIINPFPLLRLSKYFEILPNYLSNHLSLSPPIPNSSWLKNKIANSKNNIKQYPFLPDDEEKEEEEEDE